jgi:hypothetical protein
VVEPPKPPPCVPMGWSKPPPRVGWGCLGPQGVVRPSHRAKTHKYLLGYFFILALGGGRTTPYGLMGWHSKGWLGVALGPQGVVRPPLKAKTHKYFLGYFWVLALGGGRTTPCGHGLDGGGWPAHLGVQPPILFF